MIIPPFYSVPDRGRAVSSTTGGSARRSRSRSWSTTTRRPPMSTCSRRLVARLAEIDAVRSIKESTLDVTRVRDIIELCGDRIDVFAGVLGYESFWLGARRLGRRLLQPPAQGIGAAVRAGRRRGRPGRGAGRSTGDPADRPLGRRAALCPGHQGRLSDHGCADGATRARRDCRCPPTSMPRLQRRSRAARRSPVRSRAVSAPA